MLAFLIFLFLFSSVAFSFFSFLHVCRLLFLVLDCLLSCFSYNSSSSLLFFLFFVLIPLPPPPPLLIFFVFCFTFSLFSFVSSSFFLSSSLSSAPLLLIIFFLFPSFEFYPSSFSFLDFSLLLPLLCVFFVSFLFFFLPQLFFLLTFFFFSSSSLFSASFAPPLFLTCFLLALPLCSSLLLLLPSSSSRHYPLPFLPLCLLAFFLSFPFLSFPFLSFPFLSFFFRPLPRKGRNEPRKVNKETGRKGEERKGPKRAGEEGESSMKRREIKVHEERESRREKWEWRSKCEGTRKTERRSRDRVQRRGRRNEGASVLFSSVCCFCGSFLKKWDQKRLWRSHLQTRNRREGEEDRTVQSTTKWWELASICKEIEARGAKARETKSASLEERTSKWCPEHSSLVIIMLLMLLFTCQCWRSWLLKLIRVVVARGPQAFWAPLWEDCRRGWKRVCMRWELQRAASDAWWWSWCRPRPPRSCATDPSNIFGRWLDRLASWDSAWEEKKKQYHNTTQKRRTESEAWEAIPIYVTTSKSKSKEIEIEGADLPLFPALTDQTIDEAESWSSIIILIMIININTSVKNEEN